MQDLIEEAIRWIGYAVLRVVTFGRYRGGTEADRLPEGAVGLAAIALIAYVGYACGTQ